MFNRVIKNGARRVDDDGELAGMGFHAQEARGLPAKRRVRDYGLLMRLACFSSIGKRN